MPKKKKTPSRVKYEQSHPTASFRISKELYGRLQEVKEVEGKSITDTLKIGLGLLEVKVRKEQEAKTEGHEEGFSDGYEKAEALYKVSFPCSVCRKMIAVTDKAAKEAIKRYMVEHGWAHADCVNRRY